MGMIVKESVHTTLRKGIWVAAATSWRAFAATVVYCRILSTVSPDLESIAESGKVLGGDWHSSDVRVKYPTTIFLDAV
jgi:hypothetical protein